MADLADRTPHGFTRRKKGISTLEVVIIIAVLLSVALLFREALTSYASRLINSVFGNQSIIADLIDEDT